MRSQTVICVRWKLTGRIEIFVNLGKLYSYYKNDELSVSRATLDRKNLYEGYENDTVEILKSYVKC
jgi:archaellum component FlaF (FlaF/FlaG flagellin family)